MSQVEARRSRIQTSATPAARSAGRRNTPIEKTPRNVITASPRQPSPATGRDSLVHRFNPTPASTNPAATSGTNRTLLHPSGSVPLNVTHDPLEEQLLPAVW